jgi:hypothetical protein
VDRPRTYLKFITSRQPALGFTHLSCQQLPAKCEIYNQTQAASTNTPVKTETNTHPKQGKNC